MAVLAYSSKDEHYAGDDERQLPGADLAGETRYPQAADE